MATALLLALLLAAAAVGAADAGAQAVVTPADRTELALTVYSDFAHIRDARRVSAVPAGGVAWTGVPETIDPGTLILRSGDRPLEVRASAWRLDRIDRGTVLSPGDSVLLVDPAGSRIPAVVASADGGVYRSGDRLIIDWRGHVEVPARDPALPGLHWTLEAGAAAGEWSAEYLADGFGWEADYVALLEEEGPLRLDGAVTVENRTGFALPATRVRVVAGEVRRSGGPFPPPVPLGRAEARMDMAGADVERTAVADVHLYTLPGPLTVGAGEALQVPLFRGASVPVERSYVLRGPSWWYQGPLHETPPLEHPEITLRFRNDALAGPGEPLPGGTLHTYRRDPDGALLFTGDAPVPHTPAGERVTATIGAAFDLVAERTQTDFRVIDERTHESAWRISVRNHGREDRTVTLIETFPGEWTILEESRPHERVDARTARWTLPVPAGGESVLTYRVRTTS